MEFIRADNNILKEIEDDYGKEQAGYLHFNDGFTFVAIEGDRIVGFISARIQELPYIQKTTECYIDVIEVLPEYRGQGVAKRLLSMLEEESKRKGLHQIRGWSSEDKKEAISMWRRLGFCLDPQEIISEVTKKLVKGYFAIKIV